MLTRSDASIAVVAGFVLFVVSFVAGFYDVIHITVPVAVLGLPLGIGLLVVGLVLGRRQPRPAWRLMSGAGLAWASFGATYLLLVVVFLFSLR